MTRASFLLLGRIPNKRNLLKSLHVDGGSSVAHSLSMRVGKPLEPLALVGSRAFRLFSTSVIDNSEFIMLKESNSELLDVEGS